MPALFLWNALGSNRLFLYLMALGYMALLWLEAPLAIRPHWRFTLNAITYHSDNPNTLAQAAILFAMWLLLLGRDACMRKQAVTNKTLLCAVGFVGTLAWLCPPANSADAFAYIGMGRLMAIFEMSPYQNIYPGISDEFTRSGYAWFWDKCYYGPVVLPIFWAVGLVSKYSIAAALYSLKAIWLLVHGLTVLVLRRALPDREIYRQRLLLYAVNPLVLFHLVAEGHNEALSALLWCLSFLTLRRRRLARSFFLAMATALTKLYGAVAVAASLVYVLRRRRWKTMAACLGLALCVVAVLRLWVFDSFQDFTVLWPPLHRSFRANFGSLTGLLTSNHWYRNRLWTDDVNHWFLLSTRCLAALVAVVWLMSGSRPRRLAQAQFVALALLFTIISEYMQPWYYVALIPIGLALPAPYYNYSLLATLTAPFTMYYPHKRYGLFIMLVTALWLLWQALDRRQPRASRVASSVLAGAAFLLLGRAAIVVYTDLHRLLVPQVFPLACLLCQTLCRKR